MNAGWFYYFWIRHRTRTTIMLDIGRHDIRVAEKQTDPHSGNEALSLSIRQRCLNIFHQGNTLPRGFFEQVTFYLILSRHPPARPKK